MTDNQPTEPFADLLPPEPVSDAAGPAASTHLEGFAREASATITADPRPRTRWAGIVWGAAFAALAVAGVWLASGPGRLGDLSAWVGDLSPAAAVGYGVLGIGALLLLTGLVGLLRRAQRALANRAHAPAD